MMRLWVESYSKATPISSSAFLSFVAHVVVIAAAVTATQRSPELPGEGLANRAYYLPPPNRDPGQGGHQETIKYIELAPIGLGAGFGTAAIRPEKKADPESSPTAGDLGRDATSSVAAPPITGDDSVFSILEVDSSVARYPGSAAPAYPLALLREGVQGSVTTQYVVDTSGYADTSSLKVLRSSHPDFTASVRSALPYMRFFPAKVGDKRVRQLVEQEFSFRIEASAQVTPAAQATQAGDRKRPDSERPENRGGEPIAVAPRP
jgi:outer membrane biosynthesis protein TonB